ncbi:hypothetical protein ACWDUL_08720 [Nocardia niigatensis]
MSDHHLGRPRPNRIRLAVPSSDDAQTTGDIVHFTVRRSLRITIEIRQYANERTDQAPISSQLALAFAGLVATEAIAWIRRWPR